MTLYGDNLSSFFKRSKKRFRIHTVFKIAFQIMKIIEVFHSYNLVHRDIKPNNFVVDHKTKE